MTTDTVIRPTNLTGVHPIKDLAKSMVSGNTPCRENTIMSPGLTHKIEQLLEPGLVEKIHLQSVKAYEQSLKAHEEIVKPFLARIKDKFSRRTEETQPAQEEKETAEVVRLADHVEAKQAQKSQAPSSIGSLTPDKCGEKKQPAGYSL